MLIKVPRPSKDSYNPNRPVNSNLRAQVQQFKEVEATLPYALRTEIFVKGIRTEGEAAEYIRQVTEKAVKKRGLRVWYDEFSLTLGDSLRESIDRGLAHSRFGVVILSHHFFQKHWPKKELNGLASREVDGDKVILPVWHEIGFAEVRKYSPMLADRLAVQTKDGLAHVVDKILAAVT